MKPHGVLSFLTLAPALLAQASRYYVPRPRITTISYPATTVSSYSSDTALATTTLSTETCTPLPDGNTGTVTNAPYSIVCERHDDVVVYVNVGVYLTINQPYGLRQTAWYHGLYTLGPSEGPRKTFSVTRVPSVLSFRYTITKTTSRITTSGSTSTGLTLTQNEVGTGRPFLLQAAATPRPQYIRMEGRVGKIVYSKSQGTRFQLNDHAKLLYEGNRWVGIKVGELRNGKGDFGYSNPYNSGFGTQGGTLTWRNGAFNREVGYCVQGRTVKALVRAGALPPSNCRPISLDLRPVT